MMKTYNVGMVGAGFMAKAHSIAYAGMPMFFWPAPAMPVRKRIADSNPEAAMAGKERFGFQSWTPDWRDLVEDPDIDIIDICAPNNVHAEIAIAAANSGKHVICEKPLALTPVEAREMYFAAKKNQVKTMVAFNYRRTPAVQLAKKYIEEGAIGKILDFHGTYLQDWSAAPSSPLSWRFQRDICGSGALGDIGTHVVDMLRFLVGDFHSVHARTATYIKQRPLQTGAADRLGNVKGGENAPKGTVNVDDYCSFMVNCKNGAYGTIEATRNAWGRNNFITFEIHGTEGSIYFNYEHRDELQVCFSKDADDRRGFRTVYTGPSHPYGEGLWPIPALGIGYTETKIIEIYDFLRAIKEEQEADPCFRDGYAIELIADAVIKSAETRRWVDVAEIEEP